MKKINPSFITIFAIVMLSGFCFAQEAVKADPKHYKVVFENDSVRVLRINYEPHGKSVMHEHPNAVAVFLTDSDGKFTFPGGKSQVSKQKAGTVIWTPAGKHLPENTGEKPFEVILVELKNIKKK